MVHLFEGSPAVRGGRSGSVNGTSTAHTIPQCVVSIDESFEEHALKEVGQPCLELFDGPAGVVYEAQVRGW